MVNLQIYCYKDIIKAIVHFSIMITLCLSPCFQCTPYLLIIMSTCTYDYIYRLIWYKRLMVRQGFSKGFSQTKSITQYLGIDCGILLLLPPSFPPLPPSWGSSFPTLLPIMLQLCSINQHYVHIYIRKWILNRKSRAHFLVAYIYPSRLEVSVSAQAGFATVSGLGRCPGRLCHGVSGLGRCPGLLCHGVRA